MGCSSGKHTWESISPKLTMFMKPRLPDSMSVSRLDMLPNEHFLLLSADCVDPESMSVDSESMAADLERMTADSENKAADSENKAADSENKVVLASQLSLYGPDKKPLAQLELPYSISVAKMDDCRVIVALLKTPQLQIVDVQDDTLKKGAVIDLKVDPKLVLRYSDSSIIILAQQEDKVWCFQILDLDGKVQKQINVNQTRLHDPRWMNMSQDGHIIYVIDPVEGCLGFTLAGDVLFHYDNPTVLLCVGLAMDPHGALYFSAWSSDDLSSLRIIKLSPTGLVLRQINGRSTIPLACSGDKMYVTCSNEQGEESISYFKVQDLLHL